MTTKLTSSLLVSVANTQITGLITSDQISSIANNKITGTITGTQLGTTSDVQFNSIGIGTAPSTAKIQVSMTPTDANKNGMSFTKDFLGGGLDYKTASIYGIDSGQNGSGINIGHKETSGNSIVPLEILWNGNIVSRFGTSGYLGIGTIPAAQIHVYGSQPSIRVESATNSDATYASKTPLGYWGSGTGLGQQSNAWDVYDFLAGTRRISVSGTNYDTNMYFGSSNNYRFALQSDRNVVLYDGGTAVWNSGTSVSDQNLKENIANTDISGLETVNSLRVVDFSWKANTPMFDNGVKHTGFIAQEVQPIVPDSVTEISGTNLLHKEELVPALVKAVQELTQQVKNLQLQLDSIKR